MELDIVGKYINNILIEKDELNFCIGVKIDLNDVVVQLTVNNDTDEVIVSMLFCEEVENRSEAKLDANSEFASLLGRRIVSYWCCNNHQGYFDVFMLGVDEFVPTIVFSVIGSQLVVRVCRGLKQK